MGKREWQHEGVLYGADGALVGCYYNTDAGWFVNLGFPPSIERVRSRRAAIALIEKASIAAERSQGDAPGSGGR